MDPVVRYCTSADGTRIGYTTYGRTDGVPVVIGSGWVYTQETNWAPPTRTIYERLAEGEGLIGFDRRGTGRSGPELSELSLDLEVGDLEAVVDDAGAKTVDIFGYDASPAIAFAARHPDRVRRLVLYDPLLAPRPYGRLVEMAATDWPMARRALASILFPEGPVELQKHWSNAARDGATADVAAAYMRYEASADLTGLPQATAIADADRSPGGREVRAERSGDGGCADPGRADGDTRQPPSVVHGPRIVDRSRL